jgi:hypothetical protein
MLWFGSSTACAANACMASWWVGVAASWDVPCVHQNPYQEVPGLWLCRGVAAQGSTCCKPASRNSDLVLRHVLTAEVAVLPGPRGASQHAFAGLWGVRVDRQRLLRWQCAPTA